MTGELNLELLNGNWSIASLSLMVICAVYLWHEVTTRQIISAGVRARFTKGMRVAIAVLTISTGVLIRSAETWRWRVMGGDIDDLSQFWLTFGGIIAVIGFICAIREISQPLWGRAPWMLTLIAMIVFNAVSLGWRFVQ